MTAKQLHRYALILIAIAAGAGCHGIERRQQLAMTDAPLTTTSAGGTVVESIPAQPATFVDRHPLLWKPREYYDTTATGPIGKTAAATFVGVPAGILGELKQIVVGIPPATRPY